MALANIIATNIQNLLDEHKISVAKLSEYLDVSRQTMTNYLKATSVIDSVQLAKTAEFFNVPIEELFVDNSQSKSSTMLFRTALNYSVAIDTIQNDVYNYLKNYLFVANNSNKQTCYFPEQYNLSVSSTGASYDINFECQNFFDSKLKLDEKLKDDIKQIAIEQRQLLDLGDKGAISLISALSRRGINIIFFDMGDSDISGLSICDDVKGCFIFVNSNNSMTIERQLFTIAHEYGHIIMHRPIYKRKLYQEENSRTNFLDLMANYFAVQLLCPESMLAQYINLISPIKNDLNAIYRLLLRLKIKFQVSLQSLLMAFKNIGCIPQQVVSQYFRIIELNGTSKQEPNSIREIEELHNLFLYEKTAAINEMIHDIYNKEIVDSSRAKNLLSLFGNNENDKVNKLIKEWDGLKNILFAED